MDSRNNPAFHFAKSTPTAGDPTGLRLSRIQLVRGRDRLYCPAQPSSAYFQHSIVRGSRLNRLEQSAGVIVVCHSKARADGKIFRHWAELSSGGHLENQVENQTADYDLRVRRFDQSGPWQVRVY